MEFRSEHVTEKPINNLTVEGKNNDLSRVSRVNRITNLLKDFGAETLKTISTLSLEQAIGIFGAGELGKELGLLSSPSLDAEIIMTLLTMAKIAYDWIKKEKEIHNKTLLQEKSSQTFLIFNNKNGNILSINNINTNNFYDTKNLLGKIIKENPDNIVVLKIVNELSVDKHEDILAYKKLKEFCSKNNIKLSGYNILHREDGKSNVFDLAEYSNKMDIAYNRELTR